MGLVNTQYCSTDHDIEMLLIKLRAHVGYSIALLNASTTEGRAATRRVKFVEMRLSNTQVGTFVRKEAHGLASAVE